MDEDIKIIDTGNHIQELEQRGEIDSECKMCRKLFYPQLYRGIKIWNIFAPRHKASNRCESGKHPHCTCDVCF